MVVTRIRIFFLSAKHSVQNQMWMNEKQKINGNEQKWEKINSAVAFMKNSFRWPNLCALVHSLYLLIAWDKCSLQMLSNFCKKMQIKLWWVAELGDRRLEKTGPIRTLPVITNSKGVDLQRVFSSNCFVIFKTECIQLHQLCTKSFCRVTDKIAFLHF